ncbi:MAG: WYL domain-containing protein [Candidatus Nanopelagicales bacterium]|nr:WYL domain-containing protein [Candidatus Nanopelagicales bacterium]MCF8538918.1 WYL domain-containing protein [Candidatus Nanopelagicales bacterium]MCF8550700.1 WYL domain-containing protein [Candidatus Nanopelagicales bacterium]
MATDNAQERLPRLLALVPWLAQRPGITFTETAEHFGVSIDQLTTDLYQLVVCGLPGYGPDQLVDIDFYDFDRIWVTDPLTLSTPMRLTPEEMSAMLIALRIVAEVPGTDISDEIQGLIAKLERAAGDSMPRGSSVVDISAEPPEDTVTLLNDAFSQGVKIRFDYFSGSEHVSNRVVSPIRTYSVDDFHYLEAYCELAEAVRSFRLDRIRNAYLTSETRRMDLPTLSQGGTSEQMTPRALIRLTEQTLWLVDEPGIEPHSEDPFLVRVPFLSEEWLIRWILGFGGAAVVLEPQHIGTSIHQIARDARVKLSQPVERV